jgi:hypothetical protein
MIGSSELSAALDNRLGQRIRELQRRPSEYASSFALEDMNCGKT